MFDFARIVMCEKVIRNLKSFDVEVPRYYRVFFLSEFMHSRSLSQSNKTNYVKDPKTCPMKFHILNLLLLITAYIWVF